MFVGVLAAGTGQELRSITRSAAHVGGDSQGCCWRGCLRMHHGADGLRVVVRLSRVVVDPVVWYPGWWFPGVRDQRRVLEVCVHVVL